MRNFNTKLCLILFLVQLLLPLFAIKSAESGKAETKKQESALSVGANSAAAVKEDKVRLKIAETGEIEEMPMRDYIYGVIAAEYPLLYEEEALKAGIIAAHTYTRYLMNKNAESEYDVITDYTVCQAYITKEEAMENWGSGANEYDEKLEKLLDESLSYIITYKDEPIFAAYHAISAGQTENSENVWESEVAYLRSVESVGDKLAKDYLTEVKMKVTDAESKLGLASGTLKNAKLSKTAAGNVLEIKASKLSVSGADAVKALGLRSANFDMSISNGTVVFTVRGFGHQAGMSQNGANYMAKNGENAEEILKHYFKGVEIIEEK